MEVNKVHCGDCLELMKEVEDKSINMILCDLPYGTTPANWDLRIPMEKLWKEYERVIKDDGAIVLTSQQPFTSSCPIRQITKNHINRIIIYFFHQF